MGVVSNKAAKAYDWNDLVKKQTIEDSVGGTPVLLVLENDTASFHAWNRNINDQTLHFEKSKSSDTLTDTNTRSVWNMNGICIDGPLKGSQLKTIQAYQEFWHSWKNFRPATGRYP